MPTGPGIPRRCRGAIFAYNHATWYVDEVLALASEYAQNSPRYLAGAARLAYRFLDRRLHGPARRRPRPARQVAALAMPHRAAKA